MKPFKTLAVGIIALFAMTTTAFACQINARVSIVGNEFEAIKAVAAGAQECKGAQVTANLTKDHQKINRPGMTINPAEYTTAIVANSSLVELMNDDLVRPLDSLVAKHGKSLKPSQLIKVNDNIMAVAFMANAQVFIYRKDVLADNGLKVPTTYEEMLANAKILRDRGVMPNPIGGAYSAGWSLAQEFNNMFIGYGGTHFKRGSAEPNINSPAGIKALETMKALTGYMNPDFLTHNNNETNAEYRAGNVAMMHMWGSRASQQTTTEGVIEAVKKGHAVAGPLTVGGNDIPASTFWWDGWTVAKNISDAEAEATFIAMMNGIRPELMKNPETVGLAVWLIDGYKPDENSVGTIDAANRSTTPYPMLPYMSAMHSALGEELVGFFKGEESAEQALRDAEAAYRAAAKEKGFL